MISAERCFDVALIRQAIAHPKLYAQLSDDGCPSAEEFDVQLRDGLIFVAMRDGDEFLGVFLFHPHNHVCYEVHTCLLPVAWGQRALECTKAAAQWMYENTPCQRIVTNVPVYNRLALRLARNSGMEQFGLNPKSFLKNGILHDQIMLGMNKE